ncbi:MAG: hypothetical protein HYX29_01825 [Solirubrobacterales bacterium]|nr:hypothetical protein [Solirubrobacterales bacterium]
MATIQVRNLPDATVRAWKVRAAKRGQSLQEYMREYLTAEAERPTVEELLNEIETRHDSSKPDLPLDITLAGIDETWE